MGWGGSLGWTFESESKPGQTRYWRCHVTSFNRARAEGSFFVNFCVESIWILFGLDSGLCFFFSITGISFHVLRPLRSDQHPIPLTLALLDPTTSLHGQYALSGLRTHGHIPTPFISDPFICVRTTKHVFPPSPASIIWPR